MMSAGCVFEAYGGLIGRCVRVVLHDRSFVRGLLYVIDPEDDSVVLFLPTSSLDADVGVTVLLGHVVDRIEEDDAPGDVTFLLDRMAASTESLEATARRNESREEIPEKLTKLLDHHLIPHQMSSDGHIEILGGAAIWRAPYQTAACLECSNEQILHRLLAIQTHLVHDVERYR
ncbi:hypothetical protein Poli38472_011401 [Pythium oligandrum]|uniref:Uncharacterized protein n=1 Tax=Pythium oligandrum TaxID=41045 RepID=A0A8K1CJ22_PYTOL|nr:hypothetical protein Poli38472_011401 [Pythium oligandrum]|eukprot:TMW64521.1 hypothetical protein Poli38472_011401 [Pythium oligandrum]